MPLVEITMIEGRSPEMKKDLIRNVTNAVVESLHAKKESVRIVIREIPKDHWAVGGVPMSELNR
jgi:4-oxalocrotonate tautomerase